MTTSTVALGQAAADEPPIGAPTLAAFAYVDTAVGGAHNRNRVRRWADFAPPDGATGVFATYLRYAEDLLLHANLNPLVAPERRPSVAGFRGIAFAPFFPADFDCAADPELARSDAVRAVRALAASHNLPPDAVRVAFSGHKGFALEIPGALFGGFAPATDLPYRFGRLARALFPGCPTLDPRLYEALRLWRIPNTRHGRSGLCKVPLTLSELERLSMAEIRALAASPRPWRDAPEDDWLSRPGLAALWAATASAARDEAKVEVQTVAVGSRALSDTQERSLVALVADHWFPGKQHHLALGLAGCLALAGVPEDEAARVVARLSAEDPEAEDRLRCVGDTYARHRAGLPVTGAERLADVLPAEDLDALERILPTRPRLVRASHVGVSAAPTRSRALRAREVRRA